MIAQFVLTAALVLVAIYAVSQRRRAPLPSVAMVLISVVGVSLVLSPETANEIARLVGIGRGVDLVIYCFIVLMLAAVFNIHLRLRSEHEKTTQLARTIAIMTSKEQDGCDK